MPNQKSGYSTPKKNQTAKNLPAFQDQGSLVAKVQP